MAFRTNKMPVLQEKSVSGAVASFNTALAMPLVECKTEFMCTQEAGTPSPSNPLAITGVDEVHINMANFNQLVKNGNFADASNWMPQDASSGSISASDNELTYTFISVKNTPFSNTVRQSINTIANHVYFSTYDIDLPRNSSVNIFYAASSVRADFTSGKHTIATIQKPNASGTDMYYGVARAENSGYQVGDTYKISKVNLIDLTQMFGVKLADYLYSLEQQTAGAGVAVFRQLFYKDYYAYNVGGTWVSIASVNGDTFPDYCLIDLDGTRYGGYVDVVNRVLTINTIGFVCSNSDDIRLEGDGQIRQIVFYTTLSGYPLIVTSGTVISSHFSRNIAAGQEGRLAFVTNRLYGNIDIDRLDTVDNAGAKKWCVDNNVQFAYSITPIEISLSDIPTLSTIIGNNSFASDSGNIELSYKDLDIAKRGNFREVFKLPS